VLVLIWIVGLVALRAKRTFTVARYALTVADAALIAGAVATLRGPLAVLLPDMSFGPALEGVVRAYVPALLVFLALSGAFRIDPRPAALAAVLAAATYAYYAIRFEVPLSDWGLLGLIIVSGIVATTMARVIRYIALRALEQEILEDYVPEGASRELELSGTLDRAGRVEDLTLLLCDIRGFTQISEKLSPQETVAFVNSYLDLVCPPIVGSGGVIDKFMGDGVLAFFEGGGHAARALEAARRILASVERSGRTSGPIRIGVALHTGEVLIGSIGPRARREYTIISDAVNTLTRLEELNKVYGSVVVASAATMTNVDEPDRDGFAGPIDVALRGRGAGIKVFVLGATVPLGDQQALDDRLRRFVGRESG
jgi:adenylate cyclase